MPWRPPPPPYYSAYTRCSSPLLNYERRSVECKPLPSICKQVPLIFMIKQCHGCWLPCYGCRMVLGRDPSAKEILAQYIHQNLIYYSVSHRILYMTFSPNPSITHFFIIQLTNREKRDKPEKIPLPLMEEKMFNPTTLLD